MMKTEPIKTAHPTCEFSTNVARKNRLSIGGIEELKPFFPTFGNYSLTACLLAN